MLVTNLEGLGGRDNLNLRSSVGEHSHSKSGVQV